MLHPLTERREWKFFGALPKVDPALAPAWWTTLVLTGGWERRRALFWTLHSVWALATGVFVVFLAHERYGSVARRHWQRVRIRQTLLVSLIRSFTAISRVR